MRYPRSPLDAPDIFRRFRRLSASALALGLAASQITPALATIDNTATATGSSPGNTDDVTDDSLEVQVPVAPASATLSIAKTAAVPVDVVDLGVIGAGDTITFTYVITNTGNVTIIDAVPVDTGPTFNNIAAVNGLGAFTLTAGDGDLSPGEAATYEAVYTLAALDAYRAAGIPALTGDAVENSATATGDGPGPIVPTSNTSSAETEIPATPRMTVTKSVLSITKGPGNTDPDAEEGDTINYRYLVSNTGNVVVSDITLADEHEGSFVPGGSVTSEGDLVDPNTPEFVSTDGGVNASWDALQPGANVTFEYPHLVLQAEYDNQ